MNQDRGGYSGAAELLLDGETLGTYAVALEGYLSSYGRKVWKGQVTGLPPERLTALAGRVVTVRTADGRVGTAVFPFREALILGTGEPPFDVVDRSDG